VDEVTMELYSSKVQKVSITVFDSKGSKIRAMLMDNEQIAAGLTTKTFDVRQLAAGVYNLRVTIGSETSMHNLIVLKR